MSVLAYYVFAACFGAAALCPGSVQAASAESATHGAVLPLPETEHHIAGLTDRDVPPQPVPMAPVRFGAPNVVVVLLDDVGFGAAGTFGGPVPTPTLDRLAGLGLRYNAFHTTAICSPTRASLLTGRNPHAVGMGNVTNSSAPYEGRNGVMPKSAATIAEILRQNGYSTSAWGKWHLMPHWEQSQAGPFDRWPTGMGFEKFYGFLGGETHQFEPSLYEGTSQVVRPNRDPYHLTEDLADRAIAWMQQQKSLAPEKPFFVYFAPGATHAPLHAPKAWIDRFKGRFDQGWDKIREEILARQKRLGVVPDSTELTPRLAQLPSWDSLQPERKRIAARLMETYAGFLAHTDDQIGRLVTALEQMGQFENTLFFYIVGDNGASGEGGPLGTLNEMGGLQGIEVSTETALARLDEIGGTNTYPHYPAGWAWAMDTPFQWMKQVASHLGGIRNPLVVSWPRRIQDKGGLRSQFSHVSDITPTILEAAGIIAPAVVNGIAQKPMDGVSLFYSFDDAKADTQHGTQYFEVFGNRSIYYKGWMASAFHGSLPWLPPRGGRPFHDDVWELYNLDVDFSQARDLAVTEPAKLRELQDLFWAEAARNNVLPLVNSSRPGALPRFFGDRKDLVFYGVSAGIPEGAAPRMVSRSHLINAEVEVSDEGGEGVVVAQGGVVGGWSLYINPEGRPVYTYNLFGVERMSVTGKNRLSEGPSILGVDFVYDGGGFGKGAHVRLLVNGALAGEGRLTRTAPWIFSIDENFDIGTDSGSPVGDYPANYSFSGRIKKVSVILR